MENRDLRSAKGTFSGGKPGLTRVPNKLLHVKMYQSFNSQIEVKFNFKRINLKFLILISKEKNTCVNLLFSKLLKIMHCLL